MAANLSGHDKACGGWVNSDISRHEANISKLGEHFSILLVTQRL